MDKFKTELMKEIIEAHLKTKINEEQANNIIESWDVCLDQITFSPDRESIVKPERNYLKEQEEMVNKLLTNSTKFKIDFVQKKLLSLENIGRNEIYTPHWKHKYKQN